MVHRDEHLLVLAKPAHLPTTSPDGKGCLAAIAKEIDPSAPRLHPTSRLDSGVTGLVTFARTKRATEHLLEARARGAYERVYLGLAAKAPAPRQGQWSGAIAIDPRDARRRRARDDDRGKPALTEYTVAHSTERAALLHLFPKTGRTHQLRVHAAAAGVPLLGDAAYHGEKRVVRADGRVIAFERPMLHCHALRLPAIGGGTIELRDPAPDDMRAAWVALGGDETQLEAKLGPVTRGR